MCLVRRGRSSAARCGPVIAVCLRGTAQLPRTVQGVRRVRGLAPAPIFWRSSTNPNVNTRAREMRGADTLLVGCPQSWSPSRQRRTHRLGPDASLRTRTTAGRQTPRTSGRILCPLCSASAWTHRRNGRVHGPMPPQDFIPIIGRSLTRVQSHTAGPNARLSALIGWVHRSGPEDAELLGLHA